MLLGGALLFGAIKLNGEAEKNQVISGERDLLQQNLTTAQEQATQSTAKIASLQSEYDSAEAQMGKLESDYSAAELKIGELESVNNAAQLAIAKLEADLQSSNAELEVLKNVPTDTAELQQQLMDVTDERDAALNANSELTAQRDAEIETLNNQRDQLDAQLQKLNSTLYDERAARTAEINQFSLNAKNLQDRLTQLTGSQDASEAALLTRDNELQEQALIIDQLKEQVSTLEKLSTDSVTSTNLSLIHI